MDDTSIPPFEHEMRVGWGDCDPARIAYTGRIPAWALEAIEAFWEVKLGVDGWFGMEFDRSFGTPFVHMSMDFAAPVTPRSRLVCAVWPVRLGQSSISFRVEGRQKGKLCFSGTFVSVFIMSGTLLKRPVPDEVREVITPLIRLEPGEAEAE